MSGLKTYKNGLHFSFINSNRQVPPACFFFDEWCYTSFHKSKDVIGHVNAITSALCYSGGHVSFILFYFILLLRYKKSQK